VADPVGGDAERDQARFRAHRLIGHPPGQPPAPLLPGKPARDRHVAGPVIGDERDERVRPAQRAVDARLARTRERRQDHLVAGAANHLGDRGSVRVPVEDCQRCPGGLRGEIHSDCQHRPTLFPG
jgi:hypothetical protein